MKGLTLNKHINKYSISLERERERGQLIISFIPSKDNLPKNKKNEEAKLLILIFGNKLQFTSSTSSFAIFIHEILILIFNLSF